MCDTPSHGSDHLWLIWKESIQNCRCYRADTAAGTDGRTDGQTDGQTEWNQYTPQQLRCSGGIINPTNYRDLNQGLLHLWSKFDYPSLNECWVIMWTNLVTDGLKDGWTDASNDNTQRPILALGRKISNQVNMHIFMIWDAMLVFKSVQGRTPTNMYPKYIIN